MRIAIIQDQLRGGGTEKHTVVFAEHFRAQGHEVEVVCFRPGGALAERLSRPAHVLQVIDTHLDFYAPGLVKVLGKFEPDAVLCMGWEANRKIPRIKKALPQVRVIGTQRTGKRLTRSALKALGKADGILANSHWARARIVSAGIDSERCVVINNGLGIRPETDASKRQAVRLELGAEDRDVVLVNVAGFRRGKGQAELLVVLAPLLREEHGPRLWLVGDGPERGRCETLARVQGIEKRVCFTGRREDVSALLSGADICVHASRMESQPNALIEAQACGLPVVAWDWAGVRETFDPDRTGILIVYGDAAGLQAAVSRLAGDVELRQNMGRLGRRFALEHFDTRRNAETCLRFVLGLTG